jgi:hypothetical protein
MTSGVTLTQPLPDDESTVQSLRRRLLAHLSLLAGSAIRESAPELYRDQKLCTTAGMF